MSDTSGNLADKEGILALEPRGASAIGKPRCLTPAQLEEAVEVHRHYGQGKK